MIRFFDIIISGIAILVVLPFMLPIMVLLKLTGEHDIFYIQKRVGIHGKDFGLLKFATMLRNSPNMTGGLYTQKDDPRMLPLGKFLRRTKINELPQLINVFIGQMSIIGYRPLVRKQFDYYSEETKAVLYYAKPGLSGLGSIAFRNEETILMDVEDKAVFDQKVIAPYKAALELYYIKNRSLGLYFRLIVMTAEAVLHSKADSWKKKLKELPEIPEDLQAYL